MLVIATILHTQWQSPTATATVPRAGLLALFDLSSGELVWQRPLDSPSGVCFIADELFVNSMFGNQIFVLDHVLRVCRGFSASSMNDLHSMVATRRGMLVTSSGLDTVVEYDPYGDVLWQRSWSLKQPGSLFLAPTRGGKAGRAANRSWIPLS